MKYTLAFLIATIATVTASAGSQTCLDVKQLIRNSHNELTCPAISEVCVKDYDSLTNKNGTVEYTAKAIVLKGENNKSVQLPFSEYNRNPECIETFYSLVFTTQNGHYVELSYINQYEDNTGEFGSLRVYTGKRTDSNPSEQACEYAVSAK